MLKKKCLFPGLFVFVFVLVLVFASVSNLHAANIKLKKKTMTPTEGMTLTTMPDLVIKNAAWSNPIKHGDIVGESSILNITIFNRGSALAGENRLRITCMPLTGNSYPYVLSGFIDVQPLEKGKSMTYAWPHSSPLDKWKAGKYRINLSVDYGNKIKELKENNNNKGLTFTVLLEKAFIKKLKVQPKTKRQFDILPDLKLVSITMNPAHPTAGEKVEVVVKVENAGQVNTPSVSTRMEFWDAAPGADYRGHRFFRSLPTLPSLIPGQSYYLREELDFVMFGDNAAVTVKVDKHDQLEEYNEANNEKTHYFSVICKPDLAFEHHMQANPGQTMGVNVKAGEKTSIPIKLYNNGWCQSKAGKISVTGDEVEPFLLHLPALAPCNVNTGTKGYQIHLEWDTPGQKHCVIKIDSTNTNDESREYNNELKVVVNVLSN